MLATDVISWAAIANPFSMRNLHCTDQYQFEKLTHLYGGFYLSCRRRNGNEFSEIKNVNAGLSLHSYREPGNCFWKRPWQLSKYKMYIWSCANKKPLESLVQMLQVLPFTHKPSGEKPKSCKFSMHNKTGARRCTKTQWEVNYVSYLYIVLLWWSTHLVGFYGMQRFSIFNFLES